MAEQRKAIYMAVFSIAVLVMFASQYLFSEHVAFNVQLPNWERLRNVYTFSNPIKEDVLKISKVSNRPVQGSNRTVQGSNRTVQGSNRTVQGSNRTVQASKSTESEQSRFLIYDCEKSQGCAGMGKKRPPPLIFGNVSRFLIFQCIHGQECGGMADRQKGIVSAFILSQMLGVRFGIHVNKPCPLKQFLQPNTIPWDIDSSNYTNLSKQTLNLIGQRHVNITALSSNLGKDIIYFRGNYDMVPNLMTYPLYRQLPWTKGLSHYDVHKYVYDNLFKLSNGTKLKHDSFLHNVNRSRLLCAHLRMGRTKQMPRDVHRTKTSPDINTVLQFLQMKKKSSDKIFVAADSEDALSVFRKAFAGDFLENKGRILHLEFGKQSANCDGVERVILDQTVLSECDTLIMSYSGFSRMAALLRGRDDELYEVLRGKIFATRRQDPSFKWATPFF